MLRKIFILLLAGFLSAFSNISIADNNKRTDNKQSVNQRYVTGTVLDAADTVVQSIHDFMKYGPTQLAPFTDLFDKGGVRFMPYNRKEGSDRTLSAVSFHNTYSQPNPPTMPWGTQYNTGNPIFMNIHDYCVNYVWDFKYTTSPTTVTLIDTSSDFLSQNTLVNNLFSSYPRPQYRIVEYHQPGTSAYNYYDWSSLIVILKGKDSNFTNAGDVNRWKLIGLAHGASAS